jgi:hypothetical protein
VIEQALRSPKLDDALYETGLSFALHDDPAVLWAFVDSALPQVLAPLPFLCRLADAASHHTRFGVAAELLYRALDIEPENVELHFALAIALEENGEFDAARAEWQHDRLRGIKRRVPYRGSAAPIRVLTIASALHAIRYALFVDDMQMENTVLYTQCDDPALPLPAHDIMLCAVADVESDAAALAVAQTLAARTTAPVINHPDRILRTGRAEQAERLRALPGVTTAAMLPVTRAFLQADGAALQLASAGIAFPLLVRALGFHNGRYFETIETPGDLAAAAAAMPADDLLVQSFLDTRSSDGQFRKFRVMSIGGRLYPVHLAISGRWKVHYISSAMSANDAYRAEEASFLSDMHGYLGARAIAALEAIAAATDLDYGGIDFGITPNGDVGVFEANGAMAIFLPDADPRWDYRRTAMQTALDAATTMLVSRAR